MPIPNKVFKEYLDLFSKLNNILGNVHLLDVEVDFFTNLINLACFELYFPDEIKAADAEVLKRLTALPEMKDEWTDEKKLAVIVKVYKELSDPKHPVSIAMEKMKTVPEVRIIEGLPALPVLSAAEVSEVEGDK